MQRTEGRRRETDEDVRELLSTVRRVAVLGMKTEAQADKPAFYVPAYALRHGLSIVPIPVLHPDAKEILGQTTYPSVAAIPGPIDLVNVFRRSADVPAHLDDLLAKRPRAVWMQSGIRNEAVAARLLEAGIDVVQDRCLMVDLRLLRLRAEPGPCRDRMAGALVCAQTQEGPMAELITAKNANKIVGVQWPNGLNCYSFAAKCQNPGGAGPVACVPGAKAGAPVLQAGITAQTLWAACIADGFTDASGGVLLNNYKMANPPPCSGAEYLVAVFLDTRNSFHFARHLDASPKRMWVHKPSAVQDAHNMQGGYYLLDDISNATWGPYFKFVGYLKAPMAGVTVNRGAFLP